MLQIFCRLTCLEQGFEIAHDGQAPLLHIHGLKVFIAGEDVELEGKLMDKS